MRDYRVRSVIDNSAKTLEYLTTNYYKPIPSLEGGATPPPPPLRIPPGCPPPMFIKIGPKIPFFISICLILSYFVLPRWRGGGLKVLTKITKSETNRDGS